MGKVSDIELANEYLRLRPQHSSNAATHRALGVRYGLMDIDSIRSRINRTLKRMKTPEQTHKTINFSDYVARVDDLIIEDDTPKILAALKRLRTLNRHVRVLIVSDEHFDDQDDRAITMNIRVAAYTQPDMIIFNGDTFDLSGVGQYVQDRRAKHGDVLSIIRKPYTAYVKALHAVAPDAVMIFVDGNHNERLEVWTNANATQFGDTIEEAYADLVRQGGRVLWMNGKQELDIFGHHIMHGERASKNAASATLDDFGGSQPVSAGHIHRIQKVYRRVKKQGENRWIIVTSCFAGFAGNNPPAYQKRKRDQNNWIQACQLVHVNPHGDDVHVTEIPYHEGVNGELIAVVGIEVFAVTAPAATAQSAAA